MADKTNWPNEAGLYWGMSDERQGWNVILQVMGDAPFFTIRAYFLNWAEVSFNVFPQEFTWGPRIKSPEEE